MLSLNIALHSRTLEPARLSDDNDINNNNNDNDNDNDSDNDNDNDNRKVPLLSLPFFSHSLFFSFPLGSISPFSSFASLPESIHIHQHSYQSVISKKMPPCALPPFRALFLHVITSGNSSFIHSFTTVLGVSAARNEPFYLVGS